MLSAQCTDVRVNMVTPNLFKHFPNPQTLAKADQAVVEDLIRSTGFYRNKAKNIIACSQQLLERHNGEVPASMEELSSLSGVGRKTANVILGNVFDIPGLVVDTHVTRLSNRMDLAKGLDAVDLEHQLMEIIPKKNWTVFSHWGSESFSAEYRTTILDAYTKGEKIILLTDDQYLWVSDDWYKIMSV
jgi:endonuclease-3